MGLSVCVLVPVSLRDDSSCLRQSVTTSSIRSPAINIRGRDFNFKLNFDSDSEPEHSGFKFELEVISSSRT